LKVQDGLLDLIPESIEDAKKENTLDKKENCNPVDRKSHTNNNPKDYRVINIFFTCLASLALGRTNLSPKYNVAPTKNGE